MTTSTEEDAGDDGNIDVESLPPEQRRFTNDGGSRIDKVMRFPCHFSMSLVASRLLLIPMCR